MSVTVVLGPEYPDIVAQLIAFTEYDKEYLLSFMGEEALVHTERSFRDKVDPATNETWPESMASIWRNKGNTTLIDTSTMRKSVSYNVSLDISGGNVIIGSAMTYAKQHQEGKIEVEIGCIPVVRRAFLGVPESFGKDVMNDSVIKRMFRR